MVDFEENEVIQEKLIFHKGPNMDGLNLPGWNVVDVVAENPEGTGSVDNTGSKDASTPIEELCEDNTILVFRPGTYLLDSSFSFDSYNRFGLIGYGDATFKVPGTSTDGAFDLGTSAATAGNELLIHNLTIDYTADGAGGSNTVHVNDVLDVKDLHFTGGTQLGPNFSPAIHNSDGTGRVVRLRMPDGAQTGYSGGTSGQGPEGVWMPAASSGSISFIDCVVSNFPNNGLYLSEKGGNAIVDGGVYEDNGVCSIRISDGDVIRGVTVNVAKSSFDNTPRGVWLRGGHTTLRDSAINVTTTDTTSTTRAVEIEQSAERFTIDNVDIQFDNASGHCIYDSVPSGNDHGGVISNVRCNGDGTDPGFDSYAIAIQSRDSVTFENIRADMTNVGGLIAGGDYAHIDGGAFTTAGVCIAISGTDSTAEGFQANNTAGFNDVSTAGAVDAHVSGYSTAEAINQGNGTRTVLDGYGENAGDPSVEGDWNGNGRPGIIVRDTTNGQTYVYADGAWRSI